jgi:hypothetical protein
MREKYEKAIGELIRQGCIRLKLDQKNEGIIPGAINTKRVIELGDLVGDHIADPPGRTRDAVSPS